MIQPKPILIIRFIISYLFIYFIISTAAFAQLSMEKDSYETEIMYEGEGTINLEDGIIQSGLIRHPELPSAEYPLMLIKTGHIIKLLM